MKLKLAQLILASGQIVAAVSGIGYIIDWILR